jgi:nicotinamidase/pyrazinamidase
VEETEGAAFNPGLRRPDGRVVISKAGDPDRDAYSGFDRTALGARLRDAEITSIVVCGLATDYCVRATALDGLREGFEVVVVEDAIRGVDLEPGDSARALDEMRRTGAQISTARAITP